MPPTRGTSAALIKLNLASSDNQEIFHGITACIGGKHAKQSQYLGAAVNKSTEIRASDNVFLNENLEKHATIAATLDRKSNLQAQYRTKKLVANPKFLNHRPRSSRNEKLPETTPGVVRIE